MTNAHLDPGDPGPQQLPAEVAAALRRLHAGKGRQAARHPDLVPAIRAILDAGWTKSAIARTLGISQQAMTPWAVRARKLPADVRWAMPVPPPPVKPAPPKPAPRPRLTKAEAAELRALYGVARTVAGVTPADSPKRRASERFAWRLHTLRRRGVPMVDIARALDVTLSTLWCRLARFGWRSLSPSMQRTAYRGQVTRWGHATVAVKLTAGVVAQCRRDAGAGIPVRELADRHQVSYSAIDRALYGLSWASVTDPPPLPRPRPARRPAPPGRSGRLTAHDVAEARHLYAAGVETKRALAAAYGVGQDTIRDAIHGVTWAHVTDPPPVPR